MPDCSEVLADPEHLCPSAPWCCETCLPGGGGAFWPAPVVGYRDIWVGDHGQFASWISCSIVSGQVVKINKDATVDLLVTMPNGSHFVEPNIEVVSAAGWSAYLANRKVYQGYRQEELKKAYAEWSKDGREYLQSVYSKGTYYPANHDFQNSADVVEKNADGTVNLHARFRRQGGVMFVPNTRIVDPPTLDIWLLARDLWLPIRKKYLDVADSKIAEYLGKDYA